MTLRIDDFLFDTELSSNTQQAYRLDLQQLEKFLNGRELTREIVMDFLRGQRQRNLAPRTISRRGYALMAYWEWLHGVTLNIKIPSPVGIITPKWYSIEEMKRLHRATRTPFERAYLMVLYDSGARPGELLLIHKEDVNWETGEMRTVRKGGREGYIAVGQPTLDAVRNYIKWSKHKDTEMLFPYSYWQVRRWFNEVAELAGLESFTLHRVRHSRALHDKMAGVSIGAISDHLGHTSIVTTQQIYGKPSAQMTRSLVSKPWWETE